MAFPYFNFLPFLLVFFLLGSIRYGLDFVWRMFLSHLCQRVAPKGSFFCFFV